jgi:Protein of unknown function (DUF1360)
MRLPVWAWLSVDALATYRLTRLVTTDSITESTRRWIGGWDIPKVRRPRVYLFITCPWCVSVWLAAAVVALTKYQGAYWVYVALALAFSVVAGLLALVGD